MQEVNSKSLRSDKNFYRFMLILCKFTAEGEQKYEVRLRRLH